jgi:hypothetical protein
MLGSRPAPVSAPTAAAPSAAIAGEVARHQAAERAPVISLQTQAQHHGSQERAESGR